MTTDTPALPTEQEERLYSLDAEMVIDGEMTSVDLCIGTLPEIAEWVKYGSPSIRKWIPPVDIEDYQGEYTREGVAAYARRALDERYSNIEVYKIMTREEMQELWAKADKNKSGDTTKEED